MLLPTCSCWYIVSSISPFVKRRIGLSQNRLSGGRYKKVNKKGRVAKKEGVIIKRGDGEFLKGKFIKKKKFIKKIDNNILRYTKILILQL